MNGCGFQLVVVHIEAAPNAESTGCLVTWQRYLESTRRKKHSWFEDSFANPLHFLKELKHLAAKMLCRDTFLQPWPLLLNLYALDF